MNIVDIDHLMIRVHNLDDACDAYASMGFTVTPRRKHISMSALAGKQEGANAAPAKATINNRHIIFKPYPGRDDVANFMEFMCVEDQLAQPAQVTQWMCFLLDSEGPKTVVFLSTDIDETAAELEKRGFQCPLKIPFETGWHDEVRDHFVRIQARPAVPVYGQMPFQMNPYETSTLENYAYTPWTVHPNTARYFAGATGVTNDIQRDARFMSEKVLDTPIEWVSEDIAIIKPRDIFLRIVTPKGFQQLYPGLDFSTERTLPHTVGGTVAVEDMEVLKATLESNGVPFVLSAHGIAIDRRHANNTVLEFVPMA